MAISSGDDSDVMDYSEEVAGVDIPIGGEFTHTVVYSLDTSEEGLYTAAAEFVGKVDDEGLDTCSALDEIIIMD